MDLSLNLMSTFRVVALAVTGIAGDIDIREEVHLDLDDAVTLAGFAAATLDVEGKPAGFITAGLGFGKPCEPIADGRESARIGGGI